jgi:hypothetical protein
MSSGNPWLQRQRKSDLIELAERVGLKEYVHSVFHRTSSALSEYTLFATMMSAMQMLQGCSGCIETRRGAP